MRVDVWSDVVCPWCSIGRANLAAAIDSLPDGEAADVEVVLHAYQLEPDAPRQDPRPLVEILAAKYGTTVEQIEAQQERITQLGAERGIDFRFDRTVRGNTFDAHRLLALALRQGVQLELHDRLARAYFTDGEAIGEPDVLRRAAMDVGLDEAEVDALLAGDAEAESVREDLDAARRIGISGVPFFVIDGRFGLSGAQPPETLAQAITEARSAPNT